MEDIGDVTPPSRGELLNRWRSWRRAAFESDEEVRMGLTLNQASNRSVVTAIVDASRVKRVLAKEMYKCNAEFNVFNPKAALERHSTADDRPRTHGRTTSSSLPLSLLYDLVISPTAGEENEEQDFTGRTFACLADLPLYTKVLIYQFLPIYPPRLLDDLAWLRRATMVNDGAALRGKDVDEVLGELEVIRTALRTTHTVQFGLFAVYYHCIVNTSRTTHPKTIDEVGHEHYVYVPPVVREAGGTPKSSAVAEAPTKRQPTESAAALTLTAGAAAGVRGLLPTRLYFRNVSDQELPDLYPEFKRQHNGNFDDYNDGSAEQYTDDDMLYIAQQEREAHKKVEAQLRRREYLLTEGRQVPGVVHPSYRHPLQERIHQDLQFCFAEVSLLAKRYALYGHWVKFREQVWATSCFDLRPVLQKALDTWGATLEQWGRRQTDVLGKAAQEELATLRRRLPAIYYLGDPLRTNDDIQSLFREVGLTFPSTSQLDKEFEAEMGSDLDCVLRERELHATKHETLNAIHRLQQHQRQSDRNENCSLRTQTSSQAIHSIDTDSAGVAPLLQTMTTLVHNDTGSAAVAHAGDHCQYQTFVDDVENVDTYGIAGIVAGSAIRAAKSLSRVCIPPDIGGSGITAGYVRSLTLSQCATLGLLEVSWVRGYTWEVRGLPEVEGMEERHLQQSSIPSSPQSQASPLEKDSNQPEAANNNVGDPGLDIDDPTAPITPRAALRIIRDDKWVGGALSEAKYATPNHRLLSSDITTQPSPLINTASPVPPVESSGVTVCVPMDWAEREMDPRGWIDASVVTARSALNVKPHTCLLHMPPKDAESEQRLLHERLVEEDKCAEEELRVKREARAEAERERREAWLVAAEGMSQRIWRPSLRFRPRQQHHFGGCELCSKTPVHYVGLARPNSGASQNIVLCGSCYEECYSVILNSKSSNRSPSSLEFTPKVPHLLSSNFLNSSMSEAQSPEAVRALGGQSPNVACGGNDNLEQLRRRSSVGADSDNMVALPKSRMVYRAIAIARAIEAYVESADDPEDERPNIDHIDLSLTPNARRVANAMYKWFVISDLVSK